MRPLRSLLGAALTLLVAGTLATPASPAAAGTQLHGRQVGPSSSRLTWSETGSYVLGDSISAFTMPELLSRKPKWTVNALRGRPVAALPLLVRNLRAVDRRPYRVVIELGSNQSPGWSKADYEDAIAQLPRSTRVLLVTPYKAPGTRWGRKGVQATTDYARWMQQIAQRRPHTCLVPWRARAKAHPEWLRDGLHPKAEYYGTWVDILLRADERCT